jgi:hypothetical protein
VVTVPKAKDVPATGLEYRFRIYQPNGQIYGAPLLWSCGFLTTTVPQLPYPEGDITGPLDVFAEQLATSIQSQLSAGYSVKYGRRWTFNGGETDYDSLGQIPALPPPLQE